jgi:hypothetical protein
MSPAGDVLSDVASVIAGAVEAVQAAERGDVFAAVRAAAVASPAFADLLRALRTGEPGAVKRVDDILGEVSASAIAAEDLRRMRR